ncbi:MAG: phenylalanyl-tRNA synthetase beta chain [Candidatus Binatota bacterium]|nr:phenylalanyl-tRNA synthetase beta chain [Candidatus Binatota bacterium]
MKVSLGWLEELVAVELSPEELVERLTMAGLPVDAIERHGTFSGIVAGEIVALEPHPNADRLSLCTIDAASRGRLRVISGAPGLAVGQRVPLAFPGARLADGSAVEAVEIRGVTSEGAVLSEKEIGLSEVASTVMRLAPDAPAGSDLADVLGTADTVLDVDVTPNRGDCLSILGIAREIAAITGTRLRPKRARLAETAPPTGDRIAVAIEAPDLCRRYVARVIAGIRVAGSPRWMRLRLEALGVRSINNVVDVTNYVMLERGQPLHAFDLDRVSGARLVVRRAGADRTIRTLDGVEHALDPDDLVIADAERPVALAGVMGGADSAVGDATRDVLLEAAHFLPAAVRRTSRRLGLRSEASYRFERSVDVEGVPSAADRAAELFARLAGGRVLAGHVDVYPEPWRPVEVSVRATRVNALLGTGLAPGEIAHSLRRLNVRVATGGRGVFACTPPSYRGDLAREADFVEEVARLYGYGAIAETLPRAALRAPVDSGLRLLLRRVRELLVGAGAIEMINQRFTSSDWNRRIRGLAPPGCGPVAIVNPMSSEASELPLSVLSGLMVALQHNVRQGEGSVRAFEVGRVFWTTGQPECEERRVIGGVLYGRAPAAGVGEDPREESFEDAKGVLERLFEGLRLSDVRWTAETIPPFLHPGKSASVVRAGDRLGHVGALHPDVQAATDLERPVWAFEVDFEKLASYALPPVAFRPLTRYPLVVRDLAVVAEESFQAQGVLDMIAAHPELLVESVELFDVYRGAPIASGKKSLAYSIAYRAGDRTLTDDEVNALHRRLTETLVSGLGVEPRA